MTNDKLQHQFEAWKQQPGTKAGEVTTGQLRQAAQKLRNLEPDGKRIMTAEFATFLLQLKDE